MSTLNTPDKALLSRQEALAQCIYSTECIDRQVGDLARQLQYVRDSATKGEAGEVCELLIQQLTATIAPIMRISARIRAQAELRSAANRREMLPARTLLNLLQELSQALEAKHNLYGVDRFTIGEADLKIRPDYLATSRFNSTEPPTAKIDDSPFRNAFRNKMDNSGISLRTVLADYIETEALELLFLNSANGYWSVQIAIQVLVCVVRGWSRRETKPTLPATKEDVECAIECTPTGGIDGIDPEKDPSEWPEHLRLAQLLSGGLLLRRDGKTAEPVINPILAFKLRRMHER